MEKVEDDVTFLLISSDVPDDTDLTEGLSVAVSDELFDELDVRLTPSAVLLDSNATVSAKGVVNHMEQLESILRTREVGYATEQDRQREMSPGIDS